MGALLNQVPDGLDPTLQLYVAGAATYSMGITYTNGPHA